MSNHFFQKKKDVYELQSHLVSDNISIDVHNICP